MVPPDEEPAEEVLVERLREALIQAHEDGVEVEGGWPVLNDDPDLPDWDVVVVGMAKPDQ